MTKRILVADDHASLSQAPTVIAMGTEEGKIL
jgi:hypothetical protein